MSRSQDLVSNKRAFYDYEILDTWEAGIVLVGSEVKVLRSGKGSLQDAFVTITEDEVFLRNATIPHYTQASVFNHDEKRSRKLLLNHQEIKKLHRQIEIKGLTVIPLGIYLKNNFIKVKISTARGKKLHDKREAIKKKESERTIMKTIKKAQHQ